MTSLKQTRLGRALALAAVALLLTGAAQAKTINVPANYKTIQAAINAAVKGDVVVVAKGTYKENIDFKGKAITVQSTKPTDKAVVAATIIDGQKKGCVVTFRTGETSASVLKGLTVTNGSDGVSCQHSSPTIANSIITDNAGNGADFWNGSSAILTSNTISRNASRGVSSGGSSLTLSNSTISDNSGGGVNCYGGGEATLTNNTISGNSSIGCGGVGSYGTAMALIHNTITGNSAYSGGGVCCSGEGGGETTLINNTICGNSAFPNPRNKYGQGGGVYCEEISPTLTGNIISGNSAVCGGGMYFRSFLTDYHCSPIVTNNIISGNVAGPTWQGGGAGGGLYCENSTPALTNNTISGNSAIEGGGVFCSIYSSPTIRNTIIAFNTKGGGLYICDADGVVITYCDFYGNTGGNYVNWPNQTGKNGNISKNPLFAWAAKGNFYEQSKGGRWSPGTKSWIIDKAQSPCINAGDPKSAFANEPAPNGGRINMGAYGNTKYASKSAPKSESGSLLVSAAAAPVSGGGAQLSVNLSAAASVTVTITNLAGRPVASLPASDLAEGMSTLLWSGKGSSGLRVPAGTYLARVTARTDDGTQAQALSSLSL